MLADSSHSRRQGTIRGRGGRGADGGGWSKNFGYARLTHSREGTAAPLREGDDVLTYTLTRRAAVGF